MTPRKRNWTIGGAVAAVVTSVAAFFALSGPTVVPANANLQQYINDATSGDVLQLEAGASFVGNFTLNKSLTIDGQGTARVLSPNAGPAIDIPSQAARVENVTIKNLEISTVNAARLIYDIVRVGAWQTTNVAELPANITFDNVKVYCQPTQDCQRGIALNGVNATVQNSDVREIHGRGIESQGIAWWNTPGPIRILNNRIEASTENVLSGGADSSLCTSRDAEGKCVQGVVTSKIEIRRNYLYKPLTWHERDPSYAGIDWSIKNLLEIKEGDDVVIDGNILENCWGDAQIGFAVLLTTRNQDGGNPWATVEDVTFTNNTIINVAGGFQIIGKDYPNLSQQGARIRIANNVIKLASNLGGNGRLLQMERTKDLTFENNEANPHHTMIVFSGEEQQPGLVYRKNLLTVGEYGITPASLSPKDTLAKYAPGHDFSANVLVAPTDLSRFYPAGNSFVTSWPTTVPPGIGVDYTALQAAQAKPFPSPSPSATATVTISPTPVLSPSPSPTAPPADGPSENNTRIPVATRIVDSEGSIWTLNGIRMLRNGQDTGGYGSALLWCQGRIYGKGEDLAWWQYTNPGWSRFGADPCADASPSPTPTATSTPTPTPSPSVTPTPSPSPTATPLRFCLSGERPSPTKCRCRNGVRNNGKCW